MAEYSIACESNGDLLVEKHKKNRDKKVVFRGEKYLWHYLRFVNDNGEHDKSQEFSYQSGMNEAYAKVRSELDLTKEQEEILEELIEEGTKLIKFYEIDYSDFL